jgi:hypothetical protein
MKLIGFNSGVVGVVCAMVVGLGAFETGSVAGLPERPELPGSCPSDCSGDNDGNVGIVDFLALLGQWGSPGSCDIDGGGVGISDILTLLGDWGDCPPGGLCVGGATGDCCTSNVTPGCNEPTCCDAVCAVDPFCCDVVWDQKCANTADDLCGCVGCGAPATGSCCVDNGSPFCDDLLCCDFVCSSIDSFCCDVVWDATCASIAAQVCVNCP